MSVTLRQPAPSPYLRLLRVGTPLPNLPVRTPAADAFTEEPLTTTADPANCTSPNCDCVLHAAAPDHCGPPGPVASPFAIVQLPRLQNSTTTPPNSLHLRVLLPGSSFLPGPADLGYERNHNHTTTQCLLQPP